MGAPGMTMTVGGSVRPAADGDGFIARNANGAVIGRTRTRLMAQRYVLHGRRQEAPPGRAIWHPDYIELLIWTRRQEREREEARAANEILEAQMNREAAEAKRKKA